MNHSALLKLLSVQGVGSFRVRQLIGHFHDPETVLSASIQELCQVAGVEKITAESIRKGSDPSYVDDQFESAEKLGVKLLSFWDEDFPDYLKQIHDAPVLLFYKGRIEFIKQGGIAIVGTRNATQAGRRTTETFAREMVHHGVPVISGMARGIDTAAHKGVLSSGGTTIAVLGSGLDIIYPHENRQLFESISESGLVVTEFPMHTEPINSNFPKRNRIISGLSDGVVVVEAGLKSGALITAYLALEQGKEVFAVPGNIYNSQSKGCHHLLKQGAKLVENSREILEEFKQWIPSDHDSATNQVQPDSLTEIEKKVWNILSNEPVHIDILVKRANTTTAEALSVLLGLELKGFVKQLSGMMFIRI